MLLCACVYFYVYRRGGKDRKRKRAVVPAEGDTEAAYTEGDEYYQDDGYHYDDADGYDDVEKTAEKGAGGDATIDAAATTSKDGQTAAVAAEKKTGKKDPSLLKPRKKRRRVKPGSSKPNFDKIPCEFVKENGKVCGKNMLAGHETQLCRKHAKKKRERRETIIFDTKKHAPIVTKKKMSSNELRLKAITEREAAAKAAEAAVVPLKISLNGFRGGKHSKKIVFDSDSDSDSD